MWARCTRRPALRSPALPSPARPRRAGRRRSSLRPCRSPPAPPTSPRIPRPTGHYAADPRYFGNVGHTAAVLDRSGRSIDPGQRGLRVRCAYSRLRATRAPTTTLTSFGRRPTRPRSPRLGRHPLDGSSSVTTTVSPSAVFTRPVTAVEHRHDRRRPGNNPVPGIVSYDSTTRKATFNPTSPAGREHDFHGPLSAQLPTSAPWPRRWSGASRPRALAQTPGVCPCTVFDDTDAPTAGPEADSPVELGMAFTADMSGSITGVRFFKDPSNTGTTSVSPSGRRRSVRLATATAQRRARRAGSRSPSTPRYRSAAIRSTSFRTATRPRTTRTPRAD